MQRALVILLALTAAAVTPAAATEGSVCVENATIDDLQGALAAGRATATDLVRAYTARIDAYDRAARSPLTAAERSAILAQIAHVPLYWVAEAHALADPIAAIREMAPGIAFAKWLMANRGAIAEQIGW